jgi:tricorn protease
MDGGRVTSPRWALYGLKGEWEVENRGIAPDYEVELDPKAMAAGHDPQLERAVKAVVEQLEKNPAVKYAKPQYPNYHQPAAAAGK